MGEFETDAPNVLIVDDNQDIVELMEMEMEMVNFKVFKAYGGNEAKLIIEANPQIQFVLSDTNMPQGDGYELLKYINQMVIANNKSPIHFFFITGDMDTQNMDVAALGAEGLFSKPFDFDHIANLIKKLHANAKKETN